VVQAFQSLDIRPYELMHIVSEIGAGRTDDLGNPRLTFILSSVRQNPALPLTLRCNVSTAYAYQNPGHDLDTPQGELYNARRDLRILQRLGLVPGDTRPAIELFRRLLENVESARGILWFDEVTSNAWAGEPRERCHYVAGRALGLEAIIPWRPVQDMAQDKEASVQAMVRAERLQIRPHHLMCMSCFYGGREELAPIEEDNLYEAIAIMQRNPEIPVELVRGPCMICPPCHGYNPATGLCTADVGMALRDELKDLDVLQLLGLEYGAVLPAQALMARLYERIPSTRLVCGHGDGMHRGREWRVCGGPDGDPHYVRARQEGLGFLIQEEESNDAWASTKNDL
jgi:hypothetical protein